MKVDISAETVSTTLRCVLVCAPVWLSNSKGKKGQDDQHLMTVL